PPPVRPKEKPAGGWPADSESKCQVMAGGVCPFVSMGTVALGRRGTPKTLDRVIAPNAVTANRRDRSMRSSRSCSVGIARHQHPEDRVTTHVRERQIDAVRGG